MSWHRVGVYPVAENPNYKWDLEEFQDGSSPPKQMMFVHIRVQHLSASILTDMKSTFAQFREHVTCPLFAVSSEQDDDKWERFVRFFGFQPLTDVLCNNGEKRRMFWLPPVVGKKEKNNGTIQLKPTAAEVVVLSH